MVKKKSGGQTIVIKSEDLGTYTTLNRIIKADLIEKMTIGGGGNLKDSVV